MIGKLVVAGAIGGGIGLARRDSDKSEGFENREWGSVRTATLVGGGIGAATGLATAGLVGGGIGVLSSSGANEGAAYAAHFAPGMMIRGAVGIGVAVGFGAFVSNHVD